VLRVLSEERGVLEEEEEEKFIQGLTPWYLSELSQAQIDR